MDLNISIFSTQKQGNSPEEYEDAYNAACNCIKKNFVFSVADGATESSFAKQWAEFLTEEFTENSKKQFLKYVLRKAVLKAKDRWKEMLKNKTIPWYAEEKVKKGAYTSFIGMRIFPEKMEWESISIGDCCLFIVRNDEIYVKFPIKNHEDFGNTPYLIGSVSEYDKERIEEKNGELKPEDIIYLFSDAIAQWFLKNSEKKPWKIISEIKDEKEFQTFIDKLREKKEIKNDDVTMISAEVQ